MKRTLPLIITFVIGIVMVGEFFIPHWRYRALTGELLEWGIILSAGAFILGLVNLVQVHLPTVIKRGTDWGYKVVLLGSLGLTLVLGFRDGKQRLDPGMEVSLSYKWLFDFLYVPLSATMFALLAFYIASAGFRAFRARNAEATLLLLAAALVMFASVPLGESMPIIGEYLVVFKDWILDVPNNAARRAIFIGAALGAISTGLRVILGLERSHLGGD
ncbi:MAG: hypothetical protein CMP23_12900 [Rickettsiales bacterium]|nr:hypothetical protein [Rickettsiales bacterium]|tara:strand:+ start:429 stop:1079 length:651 start_codon:yes stop_codon:yes gene_type:complete